VCTQAGQQEGLAVSIWVRAVCTKPLEHLNPEKLREGILARLPQAAEFYEQSELDEVITHLRLEYIGGEDREVVLLYYRRPEEEDDDGPFLHTDRWFKPEMVKEEAGELLEFLEDHGEEDEEALEEVRSCLARAVEIVALELKSSDAQGIGWSVALAAAACLAAQGEGLVQADGEGWLAPSGMELEYVLQQRE
jgi:hypothetical protein